MTVVKVGACLLFGAMAALLTMAFITVVKMIVELFRDGDWFEGAAFALMVVMLCGFGMMMMLGAV